MITRVVGRARTVELPRAELAVLQGVATRTLVDVGTGDGRYAYALASAHPEWLVIGIDVLDEPMAERARKACRKPAKGGCANLVYIRAAIEAVPTELRGIADEIHVVLPWGRLLEGIVHADAAVVGGLAAVGRRNARIEITLNGEGWKSSTPARYADLPVPTPDYVTRVIAPRFSDAGLDLGRARYLTAGEAKTLATTWARRLGHGRAHPRFVYFEAVRQ